MIRLLYYPNLITLLPHYLFSNISRGLSLSQHTRNLILCGIFNLILSVLSATSTLFVHSSRNFSMSPMVAIALLLALLPGAQAKNPFGSALKAFNHSVDAEKIRDVTWERYLLLLSTPQVPERYIPDLPQAVSTSLPCNALHYRNHCLINSHNVFLVSHATDQFLSCA